jgi:hypothetical protein
MATFSGCTDKCTQAVNDLVVAEKRLEVTKSARNDVEYGICPSMQVTPSGPYVPVCSPAQMKPLQAKHPDIYKNWSDAYSRVDDLKKQVAGCK